MSLQNLLAQFVGHASSGDQHTDKLSQSQQNPLSALTCALPGGLAGGAAAGGVMALLMGNKKARKLAQEKPPLTVPQRC